MMQSDALHARTQVMRSSATLHKAYALGLGVVSVACSMFSVLPLDSSIPGIRLGDDGTICRTMVSSCQKRTVGEAVVSYGKSSVAFGTGRPRRRLAKFEPDVSTSSP